MNVRRLDLVKDTMTYIHYTNYLQITIIAYSLRSDADPDCVFMSKLTNL